MQELRTKLYAICTDFINARLETAGTALQQARDAANDDTKSSAGDKFETTREMMQQEIDRNKKLLFDAQQQHHLLQKIEGATSSETVKSGSIVFTNQGNFYISISAGQVQANGTTFFAVSPSSPVGRMLTGKRTGDTIAFNGRSFTIDRVG